MAFIQNTQIIWPNTIIVQLNGKVISINGLSKSICFTPNDKTSQQNIINFDGSGNAGKLFGSHSKYYDGCNPATCVSNLNFQGSAGGNLSGNPDIIYVNMSGSFKVFLPEPSIPGDTLIENSSLLEFTTLCQLIISNNMATLTLINQYASVYFGSTKYIFNSPDTFNIDIGNISTITSKNTRYINIGQFKITFTIL
jgi:hypothetical protein